MSKANDEISLMMNERAEENVTRKPLHKRLRALKNGRGKVYFCLLGWKIYVGTRRQKYRSKTWTRCKIAFIKIFENEGRRQENWRYLSGWAEWTH